MVELKVTELDEPTIYRLLVAAITPRPIAWVGTLNAEGTVNLAPFSCCTFVAHSPPLVAVSIGSRSGALKDTLLHAERQGEFVVNMADESFGQKIADSSRVYPFGSSEADDLGLELEPGLTVAVPRVARSPVSLECKLHRIVEIGDHNAHRLLIGRVTAFRVAEQIWAGDRIDIEAFRPLGRLGGPHYVAPGKVLKFVPTADKRFS